MPGKPGERVKRCKKNGRKKLNRYQACIFGVDVNGKRAVSETREITADTIAAAYKVTAAQVPLLDVIVYPVATIDNGGSVLKFAQYVQKSYSKWQIRNRNAMFQGMDEREKEDQTQIAALAAYESLINGVSNMYSLYKVSFNAICAERDKMYRVKEVVYDPAALPKSIGQRQPKNSDPELSGLVYEAYTTCVIDGTITKRQKDALNMYLDGKNVIDIADTMSINRSKVYKLMNKAKYHIINRMVALDTADGHNGDMPVLCYSKMDVAALDALDMLKNRIK